MVGIAQLVSAPDCGSGGQGFESLYPPFVTTCRWHAWCHIQGYRQAVRHSTLTAADAGSNPASPAIFLYGILAQSVEHLTFNQGVGGSNPPCLMNSERRKPLFYRAPPFFCFIDLSIGFCINISDHVHTITGGDSNEQKGTIETAGTGRSE